MNWSHLNFIVHISECYVACLIVYMLVLTAFSNFCKWYNSFLRIIWCLLEPFSCFYSFILLNLCVNFNPYIIFSDQLPVSTKFDMRSDPGVVRNYGRLLLEMASAVPDGIVCFFVSYSYMDGIVNSWHEMGILQVISFTWHYSFIELLQFR